MVGHQSLLHHRAQGSNRGPLLQLRQDLRGSRESQGQAGQTHTQEVDHLVKDQERVMEAEEEREEREEVEDKLRWRRGGRRRRGESWGILRRRIRREK